MEISTLGEMGFEEKEPNATLAKVGSGILLVGPRERRWEGRDKRRWRKG